MRELTKEEKEVQAVDCWEQGSHHLDKARSILNSSRYKGTEEGRSNQICRIIINLAVALASFEEAHRLGIKDVLCRRDDEREKWLAGRRKAREEANAVQE